MSIKVLWSVWICILGPGVGDGEGNEKVEREGNKLVSMNQFM